MSSNRPEKSDLSPYAAPRFLAPIQTAPAKFWEGATSPWHGWGLIARHRVLWPHVVLPIVINIVVTLLMFVMMVSLAIWFIAHVHPWFHQGTSAWFGWFWTLLEIVAALALLVCAAAGAMIGWLLLAGVLGSFFYYRLARQTELVLGTPRDSLHELSIAAEMTDTLIDVAVILFFMLFWLSVGFIPVVGPPVALVGGGYFNWFLFGGQFLGYPISLRGTRRRARIQFCRRHRLQTLGLGGCVFACQLVPIAGAVLLAGAVAGGVLLHRKLADEIAGTK